MKNNKGFTLIELLGVLLILALLCLIAVPKVKKTINETKENRNISNVEHLERIANEYYMYNKMKPNIIEYNKNILNKLDVSGELPKLYDYEGYGIYLTEDGKIKYAISYDNKCYKKDYNESNITTIDFNETTCRI